MYVHGQGTEQDDKEAVKWFMLAARQGFAGAQYNLGWMNENGGYLGRPVDVQQYVDGSILVSDYKAGAIYRISYQDH